MKKKKIILPKLRYENAPELDSQIQVGFDEEKSLLKTDDRDIILDLAEQFATERAACNRYVLYGKMKMVFRNLYAGASPYLYLRERLALLGDGSDGNFCGFLPYNEFAFLRDDTYYETTEPVSLDTLSGFTQFTLITSGSTEHTTITNLTAPYHNWNLYLTYISDHEVNFPMKYTLSGETAPVLSFVSGDGIPFRVEETSNEYILTSPVKHGISQGEYIVINNNYYYVNSVGNSTYRSEDYVLSILKSQFYNTVLGSVITGKRCTDIADKDNCTSEYYVHKHQTLTRATESFIDKAGFESPIWEDEQKLLYENSVGNNDVLVVRNRMESILFYFKEPFVLSGITNNLGYTPTEVYATMVYRNGDGYFYYPPKVGYSFHMHDTWIDEHFDGDTASETGITYTDFYRQGLAFHGGNEIPVGTELLGAFVEYNPKEMKERIISEAFHKIVADPLIFNHAQTASSTYSGATPTNPIGLLYQPHYRFKLRELSPYIETSDINTPMYNLPENAVYFPNEKVWRWRDLYDDGYIDPDGYGTDYPYLNDMHYIHKDVNFYIRNEQVYTNKKDGLIDFYKNQKTDECGTNNIAYLRGYVVPSPSSSPGLAPSISVSPTVTRTPTRTPTPTGTPGASMTPSISMSMIAPSPTPQIIPDALYVSPSGSDTQGTGSVDSPFFTLNKVWEYVTAGSTVYMRGGTYEYNERQLLSGKNGTAGNPIRIYAYPTEKPIITRGSSFVYPPYWPFAFVLIQNCNYVHVKGLDVSNYTQINANIWEGMRAYYCEHSTFEQLDIHHNGGGFQLTNCDDCLVLNSDFHHNQDPLTTSAGAYGNADGMGVDSFGPAYANSHNTVRGCRFWWNTDDGIDGWDQEGYLTIENCWSFWNGFIPDTFTVAGDGNGFKLGRTQTSDPTTVRRFLYNNLAFQNKKWGFLDNGIRCNASVINNVAYDNGYTGADPWSGGFNFTTTPENIAYYIKNNISYNNYNSNADFSNLTNIDHNTWDTAVSVSDADFLSVSTAGVTGSRGDDGSLPVLNFLKLRSDSDLIWAGTTAAATHDAIGNPWHNPASMGAYEFIPVQPSLSVTPSRSISRTPSPTISPSRTPSFTPSNVPVGNYYISPTGSDTSGSGTIGNPWYSITKAMTAAVAGSLIYMRGGQYNYTSDQIIANKNGSPGNLIKVWAFPGETPIVNRYGSGWAYNTGIHVYDSTYIHLKDIEVTGYAQPAPDDWGNGILAMDVSYCIFENIKSHDNCFGMSLGDDNGISTGNLILNSDFYCNEDPITSFPAPYTDLFPYGNADGLTIRCANSTATVNTVRGCRFWWNSDDGIDLWENEGLVVLEGCQSFYNGFYKNTFNECGGDGNGFKLGRTLISNTGTVLRRVNGCLAYRNTAWGFHRNGALCNMEIYNNTAYDNTVGGFYFSDYAYGNIPFFIKNNLAYSNGSSNYELGSTSLTNISNNNWNLAVSVTDSDFLSITPTGINASRTGNLAKLSFLQLASGSDLIYVGTNVGLSLDGYQTAWHTPPSIGAYEFDGVLGIPSRTPSLTPSRTPSVTIGSSTYYYVSSSTGLDSSSRNGSSSQPWATLSYAVGRVTTAGSTIYVLPGTYYESGQMLLSNGVSIMGQSRSQVTIVMTYTSSYPSIKLETTAGWGNTSYGNQSISGIKFDGDLTGRIAVGINFRSNVHIHDCEFIDFVDGAAFFNGQPTWEWTVDNPYNDNPLSDYPYMPSANGWCLNNKFYNNTVTNCARYVTSDHHTGALSIGAQNGFEAYGNTINSVARDGYGIKFWDLGFNKYSNLHDNNITVSNLSATNHFAFGIELWWEFGGSRIYSNNIRGALDLVNCVDGSSAGYCARIYQNDIGRDSTPTTLERGILLEGKIEYVDIYRNNIHHVARAIYVPRNNYTGTDRLYRVNVYSNRMVNLGQTGTAWQTWGIEYSEFSDEAETAYLNIQNNVIHALGDTIPGGGYSAYGIILPRVNEMNHIYVDNNIILNFHGGAIFGTGARSVANDLRIRNNLMYGNGYSNTVNFESAFTSSLTNYVYSGNISSLNPQFVSIGTDFHLGNSSPAIGTGLNVGLSVDYEGSSWNTVPSIGAYEYMGVPIVSRSLSLTPTRSRTPSATRSATPSVTPSRSLPTITVAATISNTSGSRNITNVTLASPSPAGLLITGVSYPITPGTTRNGTTTYVTTNGSVYVYLSSASTGEDISVNGVHFTTNGGTTYNFTGVNTTGGISIGYVGATATAIIANHNIARLSNLLAIPSSAITTAKSTLHIAYEHTSHGEQLVQGMTGLVSWRGSTYSFNSGGSGGALDLRDHAIANSYGCWGADLGNTRCPDNEQYYLWATNTRTYLNANPGINVVIWSWCGQCSYATSTQINQYLTLMNQLEIDYPNVKFVYMTGHVDGQAPSGTLFTNNALIRNYCINNNKILYDFADIESYDPSGNFFADKRVTDCCNYDYNGDGVVSTNGADPGVPVAPDRNWALDWQNSHTLNVDWYNCSASHSYPINANMKAYAAWWLWARLGGWGG